MKAHELETRPQATPRLLRQVEEEDKEKKEAQGLISRQYDPLAQLSAQIRSEPGVHAQMTALQCSVAGRSSSTAGTVLHLQRTYGNRYTRGVIARTAQGDGAASVAPDVEAAIQSARGGGQALDSTIRVQMEPVMGADFSSVHVHTGGQADALNRSLSARAFTTGQDIFFKQGEYSPSSSSGRELLAHELTHVVQQNSSRVQTKLAVGQPDDRFEQEADWVARSVVEQQRQPPLQRSSVEPQISSGTGIFTAVRRTEQTAQRVPTKEKDTVKATAELYAWLEKALNLIEGTRRWLAGNWEAFLAYTSQNPRLGWQEGFTYTVVSNSFGNTLSGVEGALLKKTIKKGASKASGALLGAAVGTAIEPGVGTVIGFIIGVLVESVASVIFDLITGKKELDQAAAEAARNALLQAEAKGEVFSDKEQKSRDEAMNTLKTKSLSLAGAASQAEVDKIRDWAVAEQKATPAPPKADDRSLYQEMIHDWILEHAGDEEDPNKATSPAQWESALGAAKDPKAANEERKAYGLPPLPHALPKGADLDNHPEIFAYQTRGHWATYGIPGIAEANNMIEKVRTIQKEQPVDAAKAVMGYFDGKAFVFKSTKSPQLLIRLVNEEDADFTILEAQKRGIEMNQFVLECTMDLSSADGSVYVSEWEYRLTWTGDVPWYAANSTKFDVSPD